MGRPVNILTEKCEECGAPLDQYGRCAKCEEENAGGGCGGDCHREHGGWVDCLSSLPDCDCPMIGYYKFHLPGCRFF